MSSDYKTMTTAQVREDFLTFFADKGCKRVASSSLVPDDPSLLLANAGMNQFKQYYLGTKTMKEIGATSCQKCLRTNDIENIGDARHLSFFEMLGNFSFGGYDKHQACAWAFDFITNEEHLGLPLDRLYFTVFTEDNEGKDIWLKLGVPEDHISRLGEDDNFWAAGPTGPCGPCSEIYFDQGEEYGCGDPNCAPGCDCDRYLEFWNLVFTQYDRQEDGTLVDLPHQNIDTGMGLERIASIMQHQHTNYEGDVMRTLITIGEKLSGKKYGEDETTDVSLRILADHSRAVTFMIADGILPSNEGRGYILRRLLRRAVFHGRLLGIEGGFVETYAKEVQRLLGDVYPELVENDALVKGIINAEEQHFFSTLETGEAYLRESFVEAEKKGKVIDGETAFKLHDTYGFPIDLTVEIASNHGFDVDLNTFKACMEAQKERARSQVKDTAWSNAKNVWVELSDKLPETEFLGYETSIVEGAEVLALVKDGELVDEISAPAEVEVVLNVTPFYAEMGGEVADRGIIESDTCSMEVEDVKKREGGLFAHKVKVEEGTLKVGDTVECTVSNHRRELIRRNHTATHLLDAALKEVLGDHVSQAGSLVEPERLRFDFTHFEALTPEQLHQIEALVNAEIFEAKPVESRLMSLEDAKNSGAVALFGEKYGDEVRVISVGCEDEPFSRELCGGLHASNSAELGLFKIISESSVGSNVRRIEAVTSLYAIRYLNDREAVLTELASKLKCQPHEISTRFEVMQDKNKQLENKLKQALTGGSSSQIQDALSKAFEINGYKLVLARIDGMSGQELRQVWDTFRDKLGDASACVLASATADGKVALLAAATDKAVELGFGAGDIVREIAPAVDGRGGGRPNMAQAGGSNVAGIDNALAQARNLLCD